MTDAQLSSDAAKSLLDCHDTYVVVEDPQINGLADNFTRRGIGYILNRATRLTMRCVKYRPLGVGGSSNVPTPMWLRQKRCVISVRNLPGDERWRTGLPNIYLINIDFMWTVCQQDSVVRNSRGTYEGEKCEPVRPTLETHNSTVGITNGKSTTGFPMSLR